ncbi:MAG: beta-propeller domain-containing protein [Candidatus Micrarchaeota archaeon]
MVFLDNALALVTIAAVAVLVIIGASIANFQLPELPYASPAAAIFPTAGATFAPTAPPAPGFPAATAGPAPSAVPPAQDINHFSSYKEIASFIGPSDVGGMGYYDGRVYESAMVNAQAAGMGGAAGASSVDSASKASDYSATNVQVEGVDEADIVKNDGKYIYTISAGKVVILNAFPPSEARVLSSISDGTISNIFVNGDTLVAFGSGEFQWQTYVEELQERFKPDQEDLPPLPPSDGSAGMAPSYRPYYPQRSSFIKVYDVSDRTSPRLVKTINLQGSYSQARMIGKKVYAVYTENARGEIPMPVYAVDGTVRNIPAQEISYFDEPFESRQFTTVLGFDLADLGKPESRKVVLMGAGQNIYVSQENVYITYTRYDRYFPLWEAYGPVLAGRLTQDYAVRINAIDASVAPEWRKDASKLRLANRFLSTLGSTERSNAMQAIYKAQAPIYQERQREPEKTVVHRFALGGEIAYTGNGEVPGHVLNQFSMDEFYGNFRIATTVGQVSRMASESPSKNNVYVLGSGLGIVGRLEDLAPGEKIYSARFLGNRAYIVTFKKVDPLFVIGLEDPSNPKLLGKLKIPGYSDYLHPYDETHLIGIGKDAVPAEEGDFAWYQGVKLSLFDVSDVSNPKELASYKIGDRGTESNALHDHKAFLFSKARGLLVVPIRLAEINPWKYPLGVKPNTYGEFTFQGAYVFSIDLNSGFTLRGRISHQDDSDAFAKSGEYYYGSGTDVKRSLYMDNYLYTISDRLVKANDLNTLQELAAVALPYAQQGGGYPVGG